MASFQVPTFLTHLVVEIMPIEHMVSSTYLSTTPNISNFTYKTQDIVT